MEQDEADKAIKQALKDQREILEKKKGELEKWDDSAKADFEEWFGGTDEEARKEVTQRIDKILDLNKSFTEKNFKASENPKKNVFGYVYPNKQDTIYLDHAFERASATGKDSRAGTLCHEMSHFKDYGGTKDHVYGTENARRLAETDPKKALQNADNFEYYLEDAR